MAYERFYYHILFLISASHLNMQLAGPEESLHKITPDTRTEGEKFGSSIAISGDVMVVGSYNVDGAGCVYVYERDSSSDEWIQTAKLVSDQTGVIFGHSVAILDNVIVVGAVRTDSVVSSPGIVYVFVKILKNNWIQADKIHPTDGEMDLFNQFGYGVDIDTDGRIVIGLPSLSSRGQGSIFVYSIQTLVHGNKRVTPLNPKYVLG